MQFLKNFANIIDLGLYYAVFSLQTKDHSRLLTNFVLMSPMRVVWKKYKKQVTTSPKNQSNFRTAVTFSLVVAKQLKLF